MVQKIPEDVVGLETDQTRARSEKGASLLRFECSTSKAGPSLIIQREQQRERLFLSLMNFAMV
jgi:hypothetical protein